MARKKEKAILILSTIDKEHKAFEIAKALIEKHLAACVTVTPKSTSFYFWENKLYQENEFLLFIKTAEEKWEACQELIKEMHSYQIPEIVAIPVEKGYSPYLKWIFNQIQETKEVSK